MGVGSLNTRRYMWGMGNRGCRGSAGFVASRKIGRGMRGEKKENMRIMETKEMNPVKCDVFDSELNAGGGQFDTTSEMNEGGP